jgi:hypothetical protein
MCGSPRRRSLFALLFQLDSKDNMQVVNEISEIKSCGSTVFFEVRMVQLVLLSPFSLTLR